MLFSIGRRSGRRYCLVSSVRCILCSFCARISIYMPIIFIWKLCRHTKKVRPVDVSIRIVVLVCKQMRMADSVWHRNSLSLSWKDFCSCKFKSSHTSVSSSTTLCLSIVISNMFGCWVVGGLFPVYTLLLSFSVALNNLWSNVMNIGWLSVSGAEVFNRKPSERERELDCEIEFP